MRPAVAHLTVALSCALLTVAVLAGTGHPVRPLWFAAAALAGAAISLAWRELGAGVVETAWPQRDDERPSARGSESRVQFMSTWLQEATRNPDMFGRRLRPVLVTIVASRLRHGHGIELDTEPDAARAVTGDWLWRLLTGPEDLVLTFHELARAVDEVERL
jgi:hypothetical protein